MERDNAGAPSPAAPQTGAKPAKEKKPTPTFMERLKARIRSREFRSLVWLFLTPWAVLAVVLLLITLVIGSSPQSGLGKLALLLVVAVLILFYEQWFIDVTRDGVKEGHYKFCKTDFLATTTDGNEQFKRLTQVVDKLQSRIGEEYTDIASRTGWLVTGQAFLLAAFVAVLNAERLTAAARQWLTIGIGLAGAAISFVLGLSIFYGTALIEALKTPRDAGEELAEEKFKVPRTGVSIKEEVHTYGHYATRYISCLAYSAWVGLTLLALYQPFGPTAPSGLTLLFPPAASATSGTPQSGSTTSGTSPPGTSGSETPTSGIATSGRGWVPLESSPWFARGADTYAKRVDGCPKDLVQKQHDADTWVKRVVGKWENRASASKGDVLILVGAADRIRLGAALRQHYDTNMGLARNRAELIKGMLIQATAHEPEVHQLNSDRILVLVTGPQYSPTTEKLPTGQTPSCDEFAEDRRVQVWLPSGS